MRSLKVVNENDKPPRVSDAKFESTTAAAPTTPAADNPFGGAFVLPGTEPPEGAAPNPAEVAEPEEESVVEKDVDPADSSRILASVLGGEELIVFVRFDLTMFLPSKELSKP